MERPRSTSSPCGPGPGQARGMGRALPFTNRVVWATPGHGASSSVSGGENTHLEVLLCGLKIPRTKHREHLEEASGHYYGYYYSFL